MPTNSQPTYLELAQKYRALAEDSRTAMPLRGVMAQLASMYYLAKIAEEITEVSDTIVHPEPVHDFDVRWHYLLPAHDGKRAVLFKGENSIGIHGIIRYTRCHRSVFETAHGMSIIPDRNDKVKFNELA